MRNYLFYFLLFPVVALCQEVPTDGQWHEYAILTDVTASHVYRVHLRPGGKSRIRIVATDNIRPYLQARVHNEELILDMDNKLNRSWDSKNLEGARVDVYVTLPNLERLELSGASSCEVADFDRLTELEINLAGAARLSMAGAADRVEAQIRGAARLTADDFVVKDYRVEIAGASRSDIRVTESIEGTVSGTSRLRYRGNPSVQRLESSGVARVTGS